MSLDKLDLYTLKAALLLFIANTNTNKKIVIESVQEDSEYSTKL